MTSKTAGKSNDELLKRVHETFGFTPHFYEKLGASPAVSRFYIEGQAALENGSLSCVEQEAIQYAASRYNGSDYCALYHGAILKKRGLSREELAQVRAGGPFRNPRLQDLADLTHVLMDRRGRLSDRELKKYEAKGISREQILETLALISLANLANAIAHISRPVIDEAFED